AGFNSQPPVVAMLSLLDQTIDLPIAANGFLRHGSGWLVEQGATGERVNRILGSHIDQTESRYYY
ncbi:MAG: hypothetical protein LWX55_14110, partial [Deltaproteobacteria bacterium]|nr:hypothetical protein [Deltaproteobacteria bacterium]